MNALVQRLRNGSLMDNRRQAISLALVLAVLLYLVVWHRLEASADALSEKAIDLQHTLAWMEQVPSFTPAETNNTESSSLAGHIEETTRQFGLVDSIRRIEPEGDTRVSLKLEGVPFGTMLDWIHAVTRREGLALNRLAVRGQDTDGKVQVDLSLERPGR